MNIKKANELLKIDINYLPLEELQKHKVKIIDAWRHSNAAYGFEQAVEEGFYCVLSSESANGFVPVDLWLTHNLSNRIDEILIKEQQLLEQGFISENINS